jgi:homoserine dehydrogenase
MASICAMRVALIGFGTVGQSLVNVLHEKEAYLKKEYGLNIELVAVSDIMKGSVMDDDGLDKVELLKLVAETGSIGAYPKGVKGLSSVETIRRSEADVVIEVAWTNLETGEPGITHIKEALRSEKHVVTSNKGPIALAYKELMNLADENNVKLLYECTVMSGTPVISMASNGLAGNRVKAFKGILNGTTNYILTKMSEGESYGSALKEAQRLGYAEAEPSADVEGWDAVGKTVILANTLMSAGLSPNMVERKGITEVTSEDVENAEDNGGVIKLIAQAWMEEERVKAKVSPELIEFDDPLANVTGAMNALTLTTEGLGDVTIIGKGAGGVETAHGILSDLLAIHRANLG